ncbi:SMI1/KNR4 family protein [Thalassoroseus pseudoceratinae]|uniref:SMI1/KNR4 family protein n=1 Tax=Thalassoroseus pseudoceratinae TaxID=2713176 RepID=UPI001421880A|nr:SMI1/KNR4 family protein [Thalassoroseus pseudoceratinae]
MSEEFLNALQDRFPTFAENLRTCPDADIENVEPGASDSDLVELESSLGLELPESYKALLKCAREFWLFGGAIQFGFQHPFIHDFQPYDELNPQQQQMVQMKSGGVWPPPSNGMLCFAEFFMEADGDQVLFDVASRLQTGDYPVMYYAHESRPPSVRKLSDDFESFLNEFLDYDQWVDEDAM